MTSNPPSLDSSELTAAEAEFALDQPKSAVPFPIVGTAASAGGLEAFTQLLSHLPLDTGMGFVLIQHLEPNHASLLTEILARTTQMPVNEVQDGMVVEPSIRSPQNYSRFENNQAIMPPNLLLGLLVEVNSSSDFEPRRTRN